MKKFTLLTFFLFCVSALFSQSQRFIVFEEMTNDDCGPCASQNPGFDALLNANSTKCTSIKYHVNWPGPDPMNQQDPTDVASRVGYYSVSGVPYCAEDGIPPNDPAWYIGAPGSVTQAMIDAEYAVPSPFTMAPNHRISAGNDSIYMTLLLQCTQAVSGALVAQNVVIEKHIHFNSPPGTNGEKDFYNVMKSMRPSAAGTTLPASFQPNDYVLIQTSWKLGTIYDMTQLAAVAFIQNNTSKVVQQAVNSSTTDITMPYNDDLQVMEVDSLVKYTCFGKVAPKVTIRNNGNDAVTSFSVNYKVNDGTVSTFNWNGNLGKLKSTVIQLPEYDFTPVPDGDNVLSVYSTVPNTVADQYPKNDTINMVIPTGPVMVNNGTVYIRTDKAPGETTWEIKNSSGNVLASGGPYTLQQHLYTTPIALDELGCHTFTIYDSGGNGICCTNGSGVYWITNGFGATLIQGQTFGYYEISEFSMDWTTYVDNFVKTSMKVYPNPVQGEAKITFHLLNSEDVQWSLVNATGQVVRTSDEGSFPSGDQSCTLDARNLPAGIYLLKLQAGSQVHICKISVMD